MLPVEYRQNLNGALELIAKKLDLDQTRYNNAVEKYEAVGKWLDAEDSNLAKYLPIIYPQGSFELGTVVKPFSSEEYDLDLVCELDGFSSTPEEIKGLVGKRLQDNERYQSPMLEEMNRCWRLNFMGEFHLDILPAKPSNSGGVADTSIQVPDKELQNWTYSDPKGYAAWFKSRMKDQFEIRQRMIASFEQKSIDEVPEYRVKTTLQQAVQLLKRNRDVEFKDDSGEKPISIIISTLAGLAYANQEDLFETLTILAQDMPGYIQYIGDDTWVENPVNKKENLAEKWNEYPKRKAKFFEWIDNFKQKLTSLRNYEDFTDAEDLLVSMFGKRVSKEVFKEISANKKLTEPAKVRTVPVVNIVKPNKPWRE